MISTWTDCAGRMAGTWRLDTLLGVRDETAYYIGTAEGTGTTALIHLIEAETERGEAVRDSWELARTCEHPHIMRVFDTGDAWIDSAHLNYAATEIPDDDVAEMQSRGEPGTAQARRLAEQAGQALDFLHTRDLCHGGVRPEAIFVMGDSVKLGVDSLRRATEACRARDLQQLWEIFPVEEPKAAVPRPIRVEVEPNASRARLPWPVIGVAGGCALALLLGYRSLHTSTPAPPATPAAVVRTSPPPTPEPAKPSPVQTRARQTNPNGAWAVVAATYSSYGPAESRAQKIAQQTRRLKPHVYPPEGKGGLYYVVLGSGLTQKEADKLKRSARQAGAPHDTYVTKLMER